MIAGRVHASRPPAVAHPRWPDVAVSSAVPVTTRRGGARRWCGPRCARGGGVGLRRVLAQELRGRRPTGPLDQARRDSALAGAAATAVGLAPQIAAALTVVATQRAAHARALDTEIARAGASSASGANETCSPSPTDAAAGRPHRLHRRRRWPTWSVRCGPRPKTPAASWPRRRATGPGCSALSRPPAPRPSSVALVPRGRHRRELEEPRPRRDGERTESRR